MCFCFDWQNYIKIATCATTGLFYVKKMFSVSFARLSICRNFAVMKRSVYWFNPGNDLALAHGGVGYTAPPHARAMQRDLQLLPAWLAAPGDMVIADDRRWQRWLDEHGLDLTVVTAADLPGLTDVAYRPWGWSVDARHALLKMGARPELLPSDADLCRWRDLAHRRTTIAMHRLITAELGTLWPEPVELGTLDAVLAWAHEHAGGYVKEPWSGSGRGVYRALDADGNDFVQRMRGALQRQGSLLCEPALDRVMDFAVEFRCDDEGLRVTGYSVFQSDFHLQYNGGTVASAQQLHDMITARYPRLDMVVDAVGRALDRCITPYYNGDIGVDMLLHRDGDSVGIDACVEVNLRTTMGMVAGALGERHGMRGRFMIQRTPCLDGTALTPIEGSTTHCAVLYPDL